MQAYGALPRQLSQPDRGRSHDEGVEPRHPAHPDRTWPALAKRIESFNEKFRDAHLNEPGFETLHRAHVAGDRTTTKSGRTAVWGAFHWPSSPSSIACALAMLLKFLQPKRSVSLASLGLLYFRVVRRDGAGHSRLFSKQRVTLVLGLVLFPQLALGADTKVTDSDTKAQ